MTWEILAKICRDVFGWNGDVVLTSAAATVMAAGAPQALEKALERMLSPRPPSAK